MSIFVAPKGSMGFCIPIFLSKCKYRVNYGLKYMCLKGLHHPSLSSTSKNVATDLMKILNLIVPCKMTMVEDTLSLSEVKSSHVN